MKSYLLPLLTLYFILNSNIQAQDGWMMQDGDPERTAFVDTDMKPPFELSRTLNISEYPHDFTYAYGMIYLTYRTTDGNYVGAFDPKTEEFVWRHKIVGSRSSVGCFPAVTEELVYAGGQKNVRFYALDRMTGDSIWSFPSTTNYGRTFAIKNDLLFVNPGDHGMVCLQKDTGTLLWEYGEYSGQTVPLVDDKHAYFLRRRKDTLIALTHDGKEAWRYNPPTPVWGYDLEP